MVVRYNQRGGGGGGGGGAGEVCGCQVTPFSFMMQWCKVHKFRMNC